jgi:flagellar transcriptional activator FlhD
MNTDPSKEISDLNFTYMLLAQKLLRQDRVAAMLRLGISEELADLLSGMSLAQIVKLATSNFVLCAFRLDEIPIVQSLMLDAKHATLQLQQAHISIVLAGAQRTQALAAG